MTLRGIRSGIRSSVCTMLETSANLHTSSNCTCGDDPSKRIIEITQWCLVQSPIDSLISIAVRLVPGIHRLPDRTRGREGREGEHPIEVDGTVRRVRARLTVDLVQPCTKISGLPPPPEAVKASMMRVEHRV